MALLADAPNRLCIGDPPRNKRPLKFIGFSLEASKAGWHKRFQNLAIVKLAFILSGFHRPWQPARHLPPQLCLGLNTGNDAWPPKPGWSDIFEWNHRNFIEKSFLCQEHGLSYFPSLYFYQMNCTFSFDCIIKNKILLLACKIKDCKAAAYFERVVSGSQVPQPTQRSDNQVGRGT